MAMTLLDAAMVPLVDDAEGGIRYWPGFVDGVTADAWWQTLRDGADWRSQQRPMYDRVVAVPRLLAAYRLADAPARLPFDAMLARVRALVPAPYNAVGMNLYRDGRDSVAMPASFFATMAMPLLHSEPNTAIGSRAAAPRIAAATPNVPKSTDLVTTAALPSVGLSNGMTSTR